MSFEIRVNKEDDGVKAKGFLKRNIDVSYQSLCKLLKNKRITLNGKKIKKDAVLSEGDVIKVWSEGIGLRKKSKRFENSKDLGMDVVYESEDFFVLNKLPGVVVQGAQEKEESLSLHLAYLKNYWDDKSDFEYFHVHRIDKQTSGALVIAKNKKALRDLNELFRKRKVVKKYICLCDGLFENESGEIDICLKRNPDGSNEKVSVSSDSDKDSKRTISRYRVLKEYEYEGEDFSLVEVEIETGFMHQIRVHMKYLGHPIVGDLMYGNSYINEFVKAKRQLLHASYLSFEYKGESHEIEVSLTKDFEEFLGSISVI